MATFFAANWWMNGCGSMNLTLLSWLLWLLLLPPLLLLLLFFGLGDGGGDAVNISSSLMNPITKLISCDVTSMAATDDVGFCVDGANGVSNVFNIENLDLQRYVSTEFGQVFQHQKMNSKINRLLRVNVHIILCTTISIGFTLKNHFIFAALRRQQLLSLAHMSHFSPETPHATMSTSNVSTLCLRVHSLLCFGVRQSVRLFVEPTR